MLEMHAMAAIAGRDVLKFFRDRGRLVAAVIFPFTMIFLLGGTLQLNLGKSAGFNFIGFAFTGFLGMTLFQSTAQGLTSLMEDRQNDFAQEVFVSPVCEGVAKLKQFDERLIRALPVCGVNP